MLLEDAYFWLQQLLEEQDLIVKGNLVCEIRYKGSRLRHAAGVTTPRQAGFRVF